MFGSPRAREYATVEPMYASGRLGLEETARGTYMSLRTGLLALIAVFAIAGSRTPVHSQAFDCVLLNDDNTNIFLVPDECFANEEHATWCNCVTSLFTNPVKGEKTGLNQAIQWITDQPGVGNHRVEVGVGTLDVSGITAGTVIGSTLLNELIPQSAGVPPNTFFVVRTEVVVTAVGADFLDFDIVAREVSPAAKFILRYDPLDACHSGGIQYQGRLQSNGAGKGFLLEYHFPKELILQNAACTASRPAGVQYPAIEPNDADAPGFTVRFVLRFFTKESGLYTLPSTSPVAVSTTLRRFTNSETGLAEILELGADDLCLVRDVPEADPTPCKLRDESFNLKNFAGENTAPTARIVMVDAVNASLIPDPAELQKACGSARVLCRGGNSEDGDGGTQTLSYEWSVVSGPAGGASIPSETVNFKDTEVTFSTVGNYVIALKINDGGAENNLAETTVTINVRDDFDFNVTPTAVITSTPDPAEVELSQGKASVTLDASASSNGTPGIDDCAQVLSFSWTQTSGPEQATIVAPAAASTEVQLKAPGTYTFELLVDDGQEVDNTSSAEVTVTVTGQTAASFRRGDSDGNGNVELTDAVRTLNWLFLGGVQPQCLDAADSDDTGSVDISDAVKILNYLFLGGAPPAAPGPMECGVDAAEDELADCVYENC